MAKSQLTTARDLARDAASYPPLPVFPHVEQQRLDAWLEALRIEPVSAIEWQWPLPWTVGPRKIGDSMWFILLSGRAEAWVEESHNVRQLGPGDMMLIPAGIPHLISACGQTKPNVIAVHFYSTLFGGINLLNVLGFPHFVSDSPELHSLETSRKLAHEFAIKAPGWKQILRLDTTQLLLRMIRHLPHSFDYKNDQHGHPELLRLFPAVQWIDENLERGDIDVKQIAAAVYLSPTHFRRIFHQVFGISPIQFVRQRRIDRAAILIRTTELTLKEIAFLCGFADTAYFSRTFRKLLRMTPNAYRHETIV